MTFRETYKLAYHQGDPLAVALIGVALEAADLRARYAKAGDNRQWVPRGGIGAEAERLGLSKHTVSHILKGRGYA